jgi:hypothetical protein
VQADKRHQDRMTMPGQGPTREDLELDVQLGRQELAETVDAIAVRTRRNSPRLAVLAVVLVLIMLWRKRHRR